ncbi:putative IRON-SULFUR-BINDING REDUCTASE domain protein [Mycobacterium xenopi 3993]|nr:putative IRON-SULFUR-BINDING REDUCTASE domain protein [Mycobacterium xenopi 3993]
MLAFLIIVLHSKHLHIFLAPINVIFKRLPNGLGRCCPSRRRQAIDFENPPEDATFAEARSRTSPGRHARLRHLHRMRRCQSQCRPGTPQAAEPQLLIMDLRDHWMAKAPYISARRRPVRRRLHRVRRGEATMCPSPGLAECPLGAEQANRHWSAPPSRAG